MIGLKKDDIIKELVKAGVSLTGDESWGELRKLYSKIKTKDTPTNDKEVSTDEKEVKDKTVAYVWLKFKTYVDEDGEKRVNAGFYKINGDPLKVFPRLNNHTKENVEVFYGRDDITSRKLADISRWCGVNPDNYKTDNELFEIISTKMQGI